MLVCYCSLLCFIRSFGGWRGREWGGLGRRRRRGGSVVSWWSWSWFHCGLGLGGGLGLGLGRGRGSLFFIVPFHSPNFACDKGFPTILRIIMLPDILRILALSNNSKTFECFVPSNLRILTFQKLAAHI